MERWSWWLTSDAGLIARISIGAGIFATLGVIDLIRHGRRATRWREYAFLLAATVFAMVYGVFNDWIASRISWEHFYYGKGLSDHLGPITPPEASAMTHAAIGVGLRATWTVGLLIGAVLLIANNPRPNLRSLPYRSLSRYLLLIGAAAAFGAILGGMMGSLGWLNWSNAGLREIWRDDQFRPPRFLTVYGINLGGYVSGAIGTTLSVLAIRRQRRRIAQS